MALTWADVDLEQGTLTVRAGKTEAARRVVDLPATAVELLREQTRALAEGEYRPTFRARATDVGMATGTVTPQPIPLSASAPVFPNNRGGHLNAANFYRRWFLPATRATGFDGLTFHHLRHTYATMLADANVHPTVAAEQLGHADKGETFLRVYSHPVPGAGRQAANLLDAYITKDGA